MGSRGDIGVGSCCGFATASIQRLRLRELKAEGRFQVVDSSAQTTDPDALQTFKLPTTPLDFSRKAAEIHSYEGSNASASSHMRSTTSPAGSARARAALCPAQACMRWTSCAACPAPPASAS